MTRQVSLGFVPLVDAAPLVLADVLGFAEEEGVRLDLQRAASWSMLRDLVDQGQVAAAQMLSVMPAAQAMGLGAGRSRLEAPLILSLGGQVIGLSAPLAARLEKVGHAFDFHDARSAARVLALLGNGLRIGVPFPYSMQALLVDYWLAGLPPGRLSFRTVPPPMMPEALAEGEIDAFCVGEPWGSRAVQVAGARLLLPGTAIWSHPPEKVLATRAGWCEANPDLAGRLVRALARAGDWLSRPENASSAAEIVTRPGRVEVAPDLIERALTGQIVTDPHGRIQPVSGFQRFGPVAAMAPMPEQAAWIGQRLARRFGLPEAPAIAAARMTFRADLHARFLDLSGRQIRAIPGLGRFADVAI